MTNLPSEIFGRERDAPLAIFNDRTALELVTDMLAAIPESRSPKDKLMGAFSDELANHMGERLLTWVVDNPDERIGVEIREVLPFIAPLMWRLFRNKNRFVEWSKTYLIAGPVDKIGPGAGVTSEEIRQALKAAKSEAIEEEMPLQDVS